MGQYTSYYLYQKYEKRGNQDWIPVYPNVYSVDADGTKLKNIKLENDTNCGYVPEYDPIYRWAVAPGYICDTCPSSTATTTYCKYQKEVYQVSYDNGVTYTNVIPESARTGSLIEANSVDCGYSYVERWVNSGTTCDGYDKYYLQVKQISENGGSTWTTTDVTRTGSLIERNSTDCGYYYATQYLTFIPRQNPTKFAFNGTSATNLKYSLDSGVTWNSIALSAETPYVAVGQKIMWKADAIDTKYHSHNFNSVNSYQYDVEGNIMSLVSGDSFVSATTISINYQFEYLFYEENIVNANNLKLPATTLANYCYRHMFRGCTSLTTAPELPATTLSYACYWGMFMSCSSLTTAPSLPATTLANDCYSLMFFGCTSLTTAPELPATTLADYCYYEMFQKCTSLTTAPELPATTLAKCCYNFMFYGCTSLTTVPVLSATTMEEGCYAYMFDSCTSLTTAPELPATTLTVNCYRSMFEGCTSLTTAPELPATTLAKGCYSQMFCYCENLTTAPVLSATTMAEGCYYSMFYGCTSLTTAPELPATTLAEECYTQMFYNCTSLTTAPKLPATTLTYNCYQYMFYNCTNLNYIKCLATNISATNCTRNWVSGVSSSGMFIKSLSMNSWPRGTSGIPSGWTIQNA